MMESIQTFIGFFGFSALVSAVASAAAAVVGLFYAYRGLAFMNLAVAQTGTLGMVAAFAVGAFWLPPWGAAMLAGGALGLLFARRQSDPAQDGWLTAILYAGLGGIAVLGLHWLPEEAHDLNTTLLGSSLLLLPEEGFVTLGAGAIVLVLFIWLQRALAQVYFFPESAAARGLPVRRLRVFTDLAGGSFIALAASTLGLLPVFAAAVLPAALASSLLRSLRWLPGVTALIGFLGSLAGFVLAYYLDTPVGPTQTSLWFLIWLPSVFLHRPAVR